MYATLNRVRTFPTRSNGQDCFCPGNSDDTFCGDGVPAIDIDLCDTLQKQYWPYVVRSNGQKSPENWSFVSLEIVYAKGSRVSAKGVAAKSSTFCSPSSQFRYATNLFSPSNSPTYFDDFFWRIQHFFFQLGTSPTCLHQQLVGLGHLSLSTGVRIPTNPASIYS